MNFERIEQINLADKCVFIRTDMNVPLDENRNITDDTRILAGINTIQYALDSGARVIVATHLGRPKEGDYSKENTIAPVASRLSQLLGVNVDVVRIVDSQFDWKNRSIVMLENVRCNVGEKANSPDLSKQYAYGVDIFVHDAFATAHRAEASTIGIADYVSQTVAGLLMSRELDSLSRVLNSPERPLVAIVGGSKVSTKLEILEHLAQKVDYLIVGGGILNTFIAAKGYDVGASLYEKNLIANALDIMKQMEQRGAKISLPNDVVVAKSCALDSIAVTKKITDISHDDMILDVGLDFAAEVSELIQRCSSVIWNGPLGVFEIDQFSRGTEYIARSIAGSNAYSLAGGGDTIAAINKYQLFNDISYISTAGGALLEYLAGNDLPAITLLCNGH